MNAPVDSQRRRGLGDWLGLFVRGVAMGVAELVPGVSGGTIAFVSGIYEELVHTLAGFRPSSAVHLFELGPVGFWRKQNMGFLLVLGLGMISSVLVFAGLLSHWLEVARPVVWSFFLGLIVLSVWLLGRDIPVRRLLRIAPLGLLMGLAMSLLPAFTGGEASWVFLLGGMIAVSAWLLPAVSGSFMLLVLGLYEPVLHALTGRQWSILLPFLLGCAAGLMLFANFLSWLMKHHREPLMALLTGFMTGALVQLWPWQFAGALLSPSAYAQASGNLAQLPASCLAMVGGAGAIWLLSRLRS